MSTNMATMQALVKRFGVAGKSTTIGILYGLLKPGSSAADIRPAGIAKVERILPSREDTFVATVEAQ